MKYRASFYMFRFFVSFLQLTSIVTASNPTNKYDKCKSSNDCFGMPSGCITSQNCTLLATFQAQSSGNVLFTISGQAEENQFLALGLSEGDNSMGSDNVMFCYTIKDGNTSVGMSWNEDGYSNSITLREPHQGLEIIATSFVDGELYCEFERDQVTDIKIPSSSYQHKHYDLSLPYYLLLAKGEVTSVPQSEDNPIGVQLNQHSYSDRLPSDSPFFFRDKYDECYETRG